MAWCPQLFDLNSTKPANNSATDLDFANDIKLRAESVQETQSMLDECTSIHLSQQKNKDDEIVSETHPSCSIEILSKILSPSYT